jgi:hypothetical protein
VSTYRLLLAAAIVLAFLAAALRFAHTRDAVPVVADAQRTPGVLNPDVTQDTIGETICVPGWTKTIRPPTDYTNALKARQMRTYGLTGLPGAFQEDHLISLELGGHPTDPRNLWPEPYPRAARVDLIENELNARVCSGALSLTDAQLRESTIKHTDG